MEIKKREILYANLLGISFVIAAGIFVEKLPGVNSWIKTVILSMAFLFFLMSENIWVLGKDLMKKR